MLLESSLPPIAMADKTVGTRVCRQLAFLHICRVRAGPLAMLVYPWSNVRTKMILLRAKFGRNSQFFGNEGARGIRQSKVITEAEGTPPKFYRLDGFRGIARGPVRVLLFMGPYGSMGPYKIDHDQTVNLDHVQTSVRQPAGERFLRGVPTSMRSEMDNTPSCPRTFLTLSMTSPSSSDSKVELCD